MTRLRQVLYFSRAREALTDIDVRQILWISQRNNRQRDITGCLLYSGRHFAQVLEGDSPGLDEVLARIQQDDRHSDIVLALDHFVSTRRFPQWSMGVLYDVHFTDTLQGLIAGKAITDTQALQLLAEMNPDSMMGTLS
jgi:hypothetical protein